MKRLTISILTVIFSLTAVFVSGCGDGSVSIKNTYTTMTDEQFDAFLESLDGNEDDKLQYAINRSMLSGVSILTSFSYRTTGRNSLTYNEIYTGAGVIVDIDSDKGDAYVITNCHVVYEPSSASEFADFVYLYLYGQDEQGVNFNVYYETQYAQTGDQYNKYTIDDDGDYRIEAEIVGASVTYDIALLKVTGSAVLKESQALAASFDESDDVTVGQAVYAVGNPQGYGMAATKGIISVTSETISLKVGSKPSNYRVIRTDAAINGGNSGGGLYNGNGKLVGIINSKSVSTDIDNMGYALPGSNVKRLWQLMRDSYESGSVFSSSDYGVTRAYLSVDYDILYTYSYLSEEGVAVKIQEIGATETKGSIRLGDVFKHICITDASGNKIEDRDITYLYHLEDTMLSYRSGYTVTLTVQRDGSETDVTAAVKPVAES